MEHAAQKTGIATFVVAFYLCPVALAFMGRAPEPVTVIEEPKVREVVFNLEPVMGEEEPEKIIVEQSSPSTIETIVEASAEPVLASVAEPVATPAPNVVARKKKRRRPCLDHIDSIVQVSDTRYRVERDYLNGMALRPNAIRKLGHANWHRNDAGEIVGFRVRRIRCGSPLHQAGIRNGDIIRTVNGREPRSLPQAIRLWFKMRKKTFVRVVLTRNGQEIKFKYRLT